MKRQWKNIKIIIVTKGYQLSMRYQNGNKWCVFDREVIIHKFTSLTMFRLNKLMLISEKFEIFIVIYWWDNIN